MPSVSHAMGLGQSPNIRMPRQTTLSINGSAAPCSPVRRVRSPTMQTIRTGNGVQPACTRPGRGTVRDVERPPPSSVTLAMATIAACCISWCTAQQPAIAAETSQAVTATPSQTQEQPSDTDANRPSAKLRSWLNSYFQSLTAPKTSTISPSSNGTSSSTDGDQGSSASSSTSSGTSSSSRLKGNVNNALGTSTDAVTSIDGSSKLGDATAAPAAQATSQDAATSITAGGASPQQPSALSVLLSESEALQLPALPTTFPELPTLAPLKIQHATLSNGLRVIMVEDHEVPLVQGSILMKGGTQASPPDKVGLASLSVAVQRAGGSVTHPGPVMDLTLEELGAYVEAGSGSQVMSVDFFSSKEDLPQVLGLWAEVLREPALPQDRLAFYQDQVLNALEHKDDNPGGTARRELAKLLYGPSSIYARQPTKASVTSITTADVKQFLDYWERPDNAVLGVVGDFQPDELMSVLEEVVGAWQPAAGQPQQPPQGIREPDILASAAQSAGKVFVIDRPGLAQAAVAVGEPGVSLQDPDAYSLDVLSLILNSFGGTLFDQIRSREGLAYSVYGAWDIPPDRPGVFVGGGETSAPGEFIQGLRRVLGDATREAPPTTILEDARSQALNTWVFNFVSKSNQLQRRLVYELLGLPVDLVFRYRDAVMRVSSDDVLGAAERHLHPEQQVTVMVADAAQVTPQLKAVGLMPIPLMVSND